METISQRTMRNESGEILRRVAAGESFVITNDGTPVGVLSPYQEPVQDRLRREGRLSGGSGRIDVDAIVSVRSELTSDELLDRRRRG